jgi:uncharacterized protein YbjQ (UPF0145 family)
MIVVTTEDVTGRPITKSLGQVFGVVVRSRGLGGNIIAGLRTILGGEIHEYTAMVEDARRQAIDRMVQNATAMGANAVVRMMFDSSEIGSLMSEIVAYGTAVVLADEAGSAEVADVAGSAVMVAEKAA